MKSKFKKLLQSALLGTAIGSVNLLSQAHAAPAVVYTGQIAVPAYGSSVSAMAWAIALKQGYFTAQGLNITGIISSSGGSGDVRNLIAGSLIYADSSAIPVLRAIQSGSDLQIINENSHTTAQFVWVTNLNSPIKTMSDLRGKKITFTTPLSTTQMLDALLVQKAGLTEQDVQLIATGPYGSALTALQNDGVDVALIPEPVYTLNKGKFRPLFWSRDIFPAISDTIGVTSGKNAKTQGDVLRRIILAHRQAVEYMEQNPKAAAAIIGPIYRIPPAVIESVLNELYAKPSTDNIPFYSVGDIDPAAIDNLVSAAKLVGALKGQVDWRSAVNQEFLPKDLQRNLQEK